MTRNEKVTIIKSLVSTTRNGFTFGQRLLVLNDTANSMGMRIAFDKDVFDLHPSRAPTSKVLASFRHQG